MFIYLLGFFYLNETNIDDLRNGDVQDKVEADRGRLRVFKEVLRDTDRRE